MADTETNPDAPSDAPEDTEAPETGTEAKTTKPDDDVDAMRRALRKANKEAEATRLRLKEFEDRDKSELDKANERAVAAEQRLQAAEMDRLRQKVALDKGLPASMVARLCGDNEDELLADADELLTVLDVKLRTPAVPAGARGAPDVPEDMNQRIRAQLGRA